MSDDVRKKSGPTVDLPTPPSRDDPATFSTGLGLGASGRPKDVPAFIGSVLKLCRQHGFAISHEDTQGSFIIRPLREDSQLEWFAAAYFEDSPDR